MLVQDFRELELRPDKGSVFENFIIAELEKVRHLTDAKVNFYFYRDYGSKEVDLIIEDYKKNYITVEIKSQKGKIQNIFPIKSNSKIITNQNYFEIINSILKDK